MSSCFPTFRTSENDRLCNAIYIEQPYRIEWFYYSYLTSLSPHYVVVYKGLSNNSQQLVDTVCVSTNLEYIEKNDSSISLFFRGSPSLRGQKIDIQSSVFELTVNIMKVDSNTLIGARTPKPFKCGSFCQDN